MDLTFNKVAGAVLATGLALVGLREVSAALFAHHPVETPGYAIEVAEETGPAASGPISPPDWGTVLPAADPGAGKAVFAKCVSCHTIDQGGANGTGPNLWGVVGARPANHAGFAYSPAMQAYAGEHPAWTFDELYHFLEAPQRHISGTKMTFVGLKRQEDRINIMAYMMQNGGSLPIPAPDPARQPPAEGEAAPAAEGETAANGAAPAEGEAPEAGTAVPPAGAEAPAAAPAS